jgi:hypothetical protein
MPRPGRNPDFGTLAKLAAHGRRSEYELTDVIAAMERIRGSRRARPLPGDRERPHLLAPQQPDAMEQMTPERYGDLLSLLGRFYHLIALGLGNGLTEPLTRFALERADQAVVVDTADWITSSTVLDYVLARLGATSSRWRSKASKNVDLSPLTTRLRGQRIARHVVIPHDARLGRMLDQGTYVCERLERRTRIPVKQLALAVHQQLA